MKINFIYEKIKHPVTAYLQQFIMQEFEYPISIFCGKVPSNVVNIFPKTNRDYLNYKKIKEKGMKLLFVESVNAKDTSIGITGDTITIAIKFIHADEIVKQNFYDASRIIKYAENLLISIYKSFGIDTEVSGNDIVQAGTDKKLSGIAMKIIGKYAFLVTNINIDMNKTNIDEIFNLPNDKFKNKKVKSVEERISSIYHITGKKPNEKEVITKIKDYLLTNNEVFDTNLDKVILEETINKHLEKDLLNEIING